MGRKPKNTQSTVVDIKKEATIKKININVPIQGIDGSVLTDGDQTLTVKGEIYSALRNNSQLNSDDKLKIYNLMKKVYKNDEVEFSNEEKGYIKLFIGSKMPEIVGVIYELLKL